MGTDSKAKNGSTAVSSMEGSGRLDLEHQSPSFLVFLQMY